MINVIVILVYIPKTFAKVTGENSLIVDAIAMNKVIWICVMTKCGQWEDPLLESYWCDIESWFCSWNFSFWLRLRNFHDYILFTMDLKCWNCFRKLLLLVVIVKHGNFVHLFKYDSSQTSTLSWSQTKAYYGTKYKDKHILAWNVFFSKCPVMKMLFHRHWTTMAYSLYLTAKSWLCLTKSMSWFSYNFYSRTRYSLLDK